MKNEANEGWRNLKAGDVVTVARGIGSTEKALLGRRFTVKRIDQTHGYAVVTDDNGWSAWHVHPEALDVS